MPDCLCTVCIPSRGRPFGLAAGVRSVLAAADSDDFEILVRLDEDDAETTPDIVATITAMSPLVSVTVGPRLGYDELDTGYLHGMSQSGRGRWCWCFGDDMLVQGKGWDTKLAKVPLQGFYAEPGVHRLGDSFYEHDSRCGSYWIPKDCWKLCGFDRWPKKADYNLMGALDRIGWKPRWLDGITLWHEWNKV